MERSRVRRLVVLAALAATAGISCGREITGPPGRAGIARGLSFTPVFPAAARAADGASLVDFVRVRVLFRRADNTIALDQTITFPANADSIAVTLNVPVAGNAPESGEPMSLHLAYVNAAGDTVFRGGPEPVTVKASKPGDPAPSPVPIVLTYTGTGANATRVAISPKNRSIMFGDPGAQFSAQAFDSQNTLIGGTPVRFTSSDTTLVKVNDAGVAVAQDKRGTAFVIAELYTGPADTATVNVLLRAAALGPISGDNQTGVAGAPLAQNVVVRVLARDSVPVASVPVTFAANGGGAPGSTTVNTDASGFASTSWTLGVGTGAQAMTATVAGLVGSPVTFAATSVAGVASQLAVTTQPSNVVAGQAITPAVVVTVRTAGGLTATGFNGNVTVAIGTNPSGGTLGGTVIVAAVNGIATFAGLSVDHAGAGYTLIASSGVLTAGTSTGFTVTAAAASALAFTQQPVGGTPGTSLTPALVVAARDAFGNATSFAGTVSLAIGANPGGALLTGTTSVSAVGGIATFANVQLGAVGVGYTLVASAAGLSDATSDPFTVGAQVISWASASGGVWSNASNWNLNRVPTAADVVDIALSGTYTVTLDVNTNVAGIQLGSAVSGTQTFSSVGHTIALGGDITVRANGSLYLQSSSLIGTGTIVNDGQVTLSSTASALAVDNRAIALATGNSTLNGALANAPAATLRVAQYDGCCGTATLTVASGFTNLGTIELSNAYVAAFGAQLIVTNGTLVNAAGATIASLPGQTPGGTRNLSAQLDNQGTLTVSEPLTINRANSAHLNSGTIDVSANLTVTQSGAPATFTNTGAITIAAGRTLAINNGVFQQVAGSLGGPGALALTSVTFNLGTAFGNAVTQLSLQGATINGPGTLTNAAGRTLTLNSSSVNAPLVNDGLLISSGNSALGGALTNSPGATLRVAQVDGCCGTATLTVASGFTNLGTIELSNAYVAAFGAQLIVTNGTLVNAAGATIASLPGQTPGGTRNLSAQLDNQGTLTVSEPLTINRANSAHLNSGTIDVSANLTVTQSGAPASFANTGTITLGTGRSLAISNGTFTQAGTIGGAGTVSVTNLTASFTTSFTNAVTLYTVHLSTINGPGTFTNVAGRTFTLSSSTMNAPFVNDGLAEATGSSVINGAFTNPAGGTLRVEQLDGCCGTATLTFASGFTNQGTIELTNQYVAAFGAQLTVSGGTLVNAAGATIASLGGQTPGGARGLSAELDNQGTLSVQVPLTINRANSAHLNSGTIDASANLTVTQSGAPASLTNTGTITVAAGRTFTVQNGTFAQSSGTLDGSGTLSLSAMSFNLGTPFSNAVTQLLLTNSTVNGPATLTNATGRTLTLSSSTVNAPLVNDGLLLASGGSIINGALSNPVGATLRIAQLDGCCGTATLTVATGFTNQGTIELSNQYVVAYGAQLNVTNGTLVNAAGATIAVIGGQTPGGTRGISAELDNQGTLSVQEPLTINRANSAHQNSGTIDVSANLSVVQSGTPSSFANAGGITIAAGRGLTVNGGSFSSSAAATVAGGTLSLQNNTSTLNGATPAVAALVLSNSNATFAQPLTSSATSFTITGSSVNGPGPFQNPSGQSITLVQSTLNMPLDNQGVLNVSGSSAINGAVTTGASSDIQIGQLDGSSSIAHLAVANGFTNNGRIDLTVVVAIAYSSQLTVTNGTLLNAGTIRALGGAAPGGSRTLTAQLDNQGTLTAGVALSLNSSGADHVNTGTIDLAAANLTVQQSGTTPSFLNQGTMTLGAGRTLSVNGGTFTTDVDATITGGTLAFANVVANFNDATPSVAAFSFANTTATFTGGINTATTPVTITNSTLNGTGTLTNPAGQTLTLVASTIGMPVDNQGTLVVSGNSALGGALTTNAGSVIRIGQVDGSSSLAHLTVANGFTNSGDIELTVVIGIAYSSQLTVTTGTLTNAPGGIISALAGAAAGGTRTLTAQLDNQGQLVAAVPLSVNKADADHVNSGVLDASAANIQFNLTGTTPSLANSGSMAIGAGRTLTVQGGTFTDAPGSAIGGLGTFELFTTTATFNGGRPTTANFLSTSSQLSFVNDVNTAGVTWTLRNSVVVGGLGTFTNFTGRTLTLDATQMLAPFTNQGTTLVSGTVNVNQVTTAAGSLIRIGQLNGSASLADMRASLGFTNNGTIELTNSFGVAYNAQLFINTGTLVNAVGGTIVTTDGTTGGGTRTINGPVDNQGTITVGLGTPGRLAIAGTLTTSGTINLELGGTVANTGYDVLAVSGAATLGGVLNVALINAFTPAPAAAFPVMTFASRTGTFLTFALPAGFATPPTYGPTSVTVVNQ